MGYGEFIMETLIFFMVVAVLVLSEWIAARFSGQRVYDPSETHQTIIIMGGNHVARAVDIGAVLLAGNYFYEHRLFDISMNSPWAWIVLFVGVEFTYYWMHRSTHTIRWFWAHHSVHHSFQHMNMLAAHRSGWTAVLSNSTVFHLPLMFIGFPPAAHAAIMTANFLYQALLHTTLVGKIPFVEGLINTPSAHRVHHATNPVYINKNFGGFTLIYDRIFGTYQAELPNLPCVYGLIYPPRENTAIAILFHEWLKMFSEAVRSGPSVWPTIFFGEPGRMERDTNRQATEQPQSKASASRSFGISLVPPGSAPPIISQAPPQSGPLSQGGQSVDR